MTEAIIALIALSLMEIVLGIDNIVFISVATGKLPADQQSLGRRLGLLVALGTRLILLALIFWIAQLVHPIVTLSNVVPAVERLQVYFYETNDADRAGHAFDIPGISETASGQEQEPERKFDQEAWNEFNQISLRDLILMAGGLFLIYSSVHEIHYEVEGNGDELSADAISKVRFSRVLIQVAIMDIIFSLDSVITAVGMADQLWVMVAAVIIAVAIMIMFADQVGNFVDQNPSVKMLALAFLLLIGVMLCAEGVGTPISKGYIYFAMSFSLLVEMFNLRRRRKRDGLRTTPTTTDSPLPAAGQ